MSFTADPRLSEESGPALGFGTDELLGACSVLIEHAPAAVFQALANALAPIFLDTNLGLNRVWKEGLEMLKVKDASGVAPGSLEGARSATGGEPGAAAEIKRWSAGRKKEIVLRLMRGEPVDAISREVSVPIYKLEQWRDRALAGIDAGLKERENDPLERQLDEANRRIGELVMDVEILQKERRAKRPLVGRRSSR